MTQLDPAKIAALAATGAVLGYADPVLAQAATCPPALGWADAAISFFTLAWLAFVAWLFLR